MPESTIVPSISLIYLVNKYGDKDPLPNYLVLLGQMSTIPVLNFSSS